jgi:four helix bundle protein
MEVHGVRELVAWQRGMELAAEVYRLCNRLPAQERFGLGQQLRRAAASVPANIAEGKGRGQPGEFQRFLSIARGSLMEVETHLELALRLGYLSEPDLDLALDLASQIRRLTSRLTQTLRAQKANSRS